MACAYITGIGMSRFGSYEESSLSEMTGPPVFEALEDAGLDISDLDAVFAANSMAGLITGQEAVRGQAFLNKHGIGDIPIYNIENACASSSSALSLAVQGVASGAWKHVLVLGAEKIKHPDRARSYAALQAAIDVEEFPPGSQTGSPFLTHAAGAATQFLIEKGAGVEDLGAVAEKTRRYGSLNPLAQYQDAPSLDQILSSPVVQPPLTRLMCAPLGDGAAAVVVSSRACPRRASISVVGSAVGSAIGRGNVPERPLSARVARRAYVQAGLDARTIDVAEVHDTTAFNEVRLYEQLGLISSDDIVRAIREAWTGPEGRIPVNTSGGLLSRGHPVGATGLAQIVELVLQLRGHAGPRQVSHARTGLAHNAGGRIGEESAAVAVTILQRTDP